MTTATGQVTTFGVGAATPLDVDPDQAKNGADFMYVSESPAAGLGGAYAGLQLEKIVISDQPLLAGTSPVFSAAGNWVPNTGVTPPPVVPNLIGTNGNDILTGTDAANVINALDGNDTVMTLGGNDRANGGLGNDRMEGGTGADHLAGGQGNDLILGGAGVDRLGGSEGDDLLNGGAGRDVMTGGAGGDTFVFGNGDRVTDFNAGQGDRVVFDEALALDLSRIAVTYDATGATISLGAQTMRLDGATPFDLGTNFRRYLEMCCEKVGVRMVDDPSSLDRLLIANQRNLGKSIEMNLRAIRRGQRRQESQLSLEDFRRSQALQNGQKNISPFDHSPWPLLKVELEKLGWIS